VISPTQINLCGGSPSDYAITYFEAARINGYFCRLRSLAVSTYFDHLIAKCPIHLNCKSLRFSACVQKQIAQSCGKCCRLVFESSLFSHEQK